MTSTLTPSPSIAALKSEYGASLEKIDNSEKKVLAATLLAFLDEPESDIYRTLDECDPDCVLGERLGWVHLIEISMEPAAVVNDFAWQLLIESTPGCVMASHLN